MSAVLFQGGDAGRRQDVKEGAVIDGYAIGACVHKGGTGAIFDVSPPLGHDPGFPIVMKTPFLGRGESPIGIVRQTVAYRLPAGID